MWSDRRSSRSRARAAGDEARPADLLPGRTAGRWWTRGSLDGAEPGRRAAGRHIAFIFPGLGLGTLVSEARAVTDGMLVAAAEALAEHVSGTDLRRGPSSRRSLVCVTWRPRVAEAVVRQAVGEDVARTPPKDPAEAVAAAMWDPAYPVVEALTS